MKSRQPGVESADLVSVKNEKNSDWCWNNTARAKSFGTKPLADPITAKLPAYCNFFPFPGIKLL